MADDLRTACTSPAQLSRPTFTASHTDGWSGAAVQLLDGTLVRRGPSASCGLPLACRGPHCPARCSPAEERGCRAAAGSPGCAGPGSAAEARPLPGAQASYQVTMCWSCTGMSERPLYLHQSRDQQHHLSCDLKSRTCRLLSKSDRAIRLPQPWPVGNILRMLDK